MKVYVGAYLEIKTNFVTVEEGMCPRGHKHNTNFCPHCGGKIAKKSSSGYPSTVLPLPDGLPVIEEITPRTIWFDGLDTIIAIGASSRPNGVWDAYETGDVGTIPLPEDGMAEKLKREFATSYADTISYLRRLPGVNTAEVKAGIIINPDPERLHDPYEGSDW